MWGGRQILSSKWQGLLSSYNWFRFSSVVVGILWRLILSLNALIQLLRSVELVTKPNWLSTGLDNLAQTYHLFVTLYPSIVYHSCSSWHLLSLQCPQLTSSIMGLACLTHNQTWHLLLGWLIRECTVWKHRTSAHFNRVVQPTRPTGVEEQQGWGEPGCWYRWW